MIVVFFFFFFFFFFCVLFFEKKKIIDNDYIKLFCVITHTLRRKLFGMICLETKLEISWPVKIEFKVKFYMKHKTNAYSPLYLNCLCVYWKLGRVEFVVQFLLVLLGVGEEELVKSVRQLTNHSADSNSNQSIRRFGGTRGSALRLVTLHHLPSFSFVD